MEVPTKGASLVNIVKMCKAFEENQIELLIYMPSKNLNQAIKNIQEFGFYFKNLKMSTLRFGKLWYIISSLIKARKHSQLIYTRSVEVAFFSYLLDFYVIIEMHSPHKERHKVIQWMFQKICKSKRLVLIVSISEALKNLLLQNYVVDSEKFFVAHDGADINCFEVKIPDKPIQNVGYVGHLYKGRGIEIILDLAEKFPDLKFHIVGGDTEQVSFWKKVKNLKNLFFYGHLPYIEAQKLRNSMDVLLAPYQPNTLTRAGIDSTQWMSPLKIFEYMASGVPFISSDLPVLREVLKNERNCLLVSATDTSEWEKALKDLQNDSHKRIKIAKKALENIHDEYSWHMRANRIIQKILSVSNSEIGVSEP